MKKTHYQILGLADSASPSEIKQAYRQLAMRWHPDKNPNNQEAEEQFKAINEAHEILSDEQKRRSYDDSLTLERNRMEENRLKRESQYQQSSTSYRTNDTSAIFWGIIILTKLAIEIFSNKERKI